jgi:HTH-type transcriptional regulator/antitoxin HipB
MMHNDSRILEP